MLGVTVYLEGLEVAGVIQMLEDGFLQRNMAGTRGLPKCDIKIVESLAHNRRVR